MDRLSVAKGFATEHILGTICVVKLLWMGIGISAKGPGELFGASQQYIGQAREAQATYTQTSTLQAIAIPKALKGGL
jgi:hypothetical protein